MTDQPNMWIIIGGRFAQHPRSGSDTMLKSNEPNSISKDDLKDEGCPWLINCTIQEYLVNVRLDSHFNNNLNSTCSFIVNIRRFLKEQKNCVIV